MLTIENELIRVGFTAQGAEIIKIYNKETGLDYLWNADPAYWPKFSPVLFPVVGGLKGGVYAFEGNSYALNRHGFARENMFEVESHTNDCITFVLHASTKTLQLYPFLFKFSVIHTISNNQLSVTYKVENKDSKVLYFSVGAHPAFKVPLVEGDDYSNYYLSFNEIENAGIYPIASDGLIQHTSVGLLNDTDVLPLTKPLFYKDALIFKELKSTAISILNHKNKHGLTLSFKGFPYMGIWAFKDADFVCIEPWCGLGDTETSTGLLQDKEGILTLNSGNIFEATWDVVCF